MWAKDNHELRVAHIISGLSIGGAQRNLVNIINAMQCDYRAIVCIARPCAGPSFVDQLAAEIEQHELWIRRRTLPVGLLRLASFLRETRVNVVHTHMYESNLYGSIAAKLAGVPVVVTSEHGENPWKTHWQRWLERRVISTLADIRFCVSERIMEIRRDRERVPEKKLRVLVNGTLLPPRDLGGSPNRMPMIGAVGRFVSAKDYPRLIEAVSILRDRGLKFRACIVGDGEEFANVCQLVEEQRLNDIVELPGMAKNMDAWYRRFDIYVSSSIREGQPMALLEAMSHQLPVVTTDTGLSAITVGDGIGGLVVPPGNAHALADGLERLMKNSALRRILGDAARNRVEQRYSVEKVAAEITEYYQQILSDKLAGANRFVI